MATRGRKKGSPKTGGRKKGAKNKRSQLVEEILESEDLCPIREMIFVYREALKQYEKGGTSFAKGVTGTKFDYLKLAGDKLKELAPYRYPKLKAIEFQSGEGDDLGKSFVDVIRSIAEKANG